MTSVVINEHVGEYRNEYHSFGIMFCGKIDWPARKWKVRKKLIYSGVAI